MIVDIRKLTVRELVEVLFLGVVFGLLPFIGHLSWAHLGFASTYVLMQGLREWTGRPLMFMPDPILQCFPYWIAMSIANGFSCAPGWFFPFFLASLIAAVVTRGRNIWKILDSVSPMFPYAATLAFVGYTLYLAGLQLVNLGFSTADMIAHMKLATFFFGGIPLSLLLFHGKT